MLKSSKLLKRIGAGIMAGLCAVTVATSDFPVRVNAAGEEAFPSPDQIIAEAATLLGGNYHLGRKGYSNAYEASLTPVPYDVEYTRSDGVDCSGLIYYTLTNLGYSTSGFEWNHPVPVDTSHWLNYNDPTMTYNGITRSMEIEKARVTTDSHPYWEKADGTTIAPGSLVIGDPTNGEMDHAWIYIGEFDSKAAVKTYLAGIGVNSSYINDYTVRDDGDGGNHWRIEANGDYGVIIDNDTSAKKNRTMRVSAFKTNTDATFIISKYKRGTAKIVGKSEVDGTSAVYGVYSDRNCTNKIGEIKIGENGKGKIILPYGSYYTKEISAPTGYEVSDTIYSLVPNEDIRVEEDDTTGSIQINKSAEDGVKSRQFAITYVKDGKNNTEIVKTNTIGKAIVKNLDLYENGKPIKYTITEINNDVRNVNPPPQSVYLTDGDPDKDYTVDVYFKNELKRGSIVLYKYHMDGNNDDRTFTVTGNGETYTITTHGNEPTALENLRMYDDDNNLITYTIHETNVPDRYITPEDQDVTLMLDQARVVLFVNSTTGGNLVVYKIHEDGNTDDRTFTVTGNGKTYTVVTHGNEPAMVSDLDVFDNDGNKIVYTIKEENVPDRYIEPDEQTFTLDHNNVTNVIFTNKLKNASLSIHKRNAETNEPIEGAKFEVTCSRKNKYFYEGELVCTLTTDENGNANTGDIIPLDCDYLITEVYTPDGYVPHEPITLSTGLQYNTYEFDVLIEEQPTTVEISKSDLTTGELIEGAKLRITDKNGDTVAEWVTEKGKTHTLSAELTAGETYTLSEIEVPYGYEKADPVPFTVSTDGKYDKVKMEDAPITRTLYIEKIDETTNDVIPGAEMQIIDSKGNVVDEWTSTSEKKLVTLRVGEYTLHEKKAPDGYCLAADKKFNVPVEGDIDDIIMTDLPTDTIIYKLDEKDNPLSGATLQVLDAQGKVVDEWVTTEDGHEIKGVLTAGISYTVHEKKTPPGYTMAADVEFTVSMDGSLDEVTMQDKSTKAQFSKKSLTGADEVIGARLWIEDETGKIIDEWVSTEKPHYIEALLESGKKYILHEEVAPSGYIVADDMDFTVNENGELQIITMYDDYTKIHISKINADTGLPLVGATLQILDGKDVVEEWVSTEEVHVINAKLIAGKTYVLHEASAPDGYSIAKDIEFTVSEDGSIDEIKMDDKPTTVSVSKKSVTGENELEGAELKILDEDENIVDEWTSGKSEHVIVGKLIAGKTYTLHEEIAPNGYIVANDIEFTVFTDGSVQHVEMVDDTTKVHITKRDATNLKELAGVTYPSKELAGATLQILDGDNVVLEWTTTSDNAEITGKMIEGLLIAGKSYVLHEVSAPEGYELAADLEFTVSEDGSTDEIILDNFEKTGNVEVHKTTIGQLNIEGRVFILEGTSNGGNNVHITAITNANGIATFNNVPIGTYTIVEDAENVPYAYLVADPTEVTVLYAETSIAEIHNDEKTGNIEVHKTTKNKGNVSDIKFILAGTSDSGRDIHIEGMTDKDGIAKFEGIPVGTYTITEDKGTVPTAYLVADAQEVTVLYAETTIAEVFNGEKTGSIEIHKKTEGQLNIEGIQFILEGTSDAGTPVKVTAKTNKDGIAKFDGIPVGTYTITEDKETVPAAYLVAEPAEVTVLYAETSVKEITNKEKSGSISIEKKTEGMKDIADIKFILEGTSDSGRDIRIEAVTDKDGKATFNNIPIGTYTITEDKESVPAGYLVADAQKVTVYESKTEKVTFKNEKVGTGTGTPSTSTSTPTNPNTGSADKVNGALAVSALALCFAIVTKKRKTSDR